jgi:replicative DNA helicase
MTNSQTTIWDYTQRIKNLSAENVLLNYLINYESSRIEFLTRVNPHVFFDDTNNALYQVVLEMFLSKRSVNRHNLVSWIKTQSSSTFVNVYLNRLDEICAIMPVESIENFIETLNEAYKSRIIYKDVFLEANKMFMRNEPIENLIQMIGNSITQFANDYKETPMEELTMNTLENIFNPGPDEFGLEIGLEEFDRVYGGIKKDSYITIGAESGTGKTAFIVDMIHRLCALHADKIAICFFSMEMSQKRIMKRLFSRHSRIIGLRLDSKRAARLTVEQRESLVAASKVIRNWPFKIIYATMDIANLKMKARQFYLQNSGKHCIFFVDHIGKIESSSSDMRVNTIKNSQGLKSICTDHNATMVSLSQLVKELGSDKYKQIYHRPNESHLMESGAIKADSDIVGLLWRPGNRFDKIAYAGQEQWDTTNKMIWFNEKNRDGIEKTDLIFLCDIGCNIMENTPQPF